MLNNLFSSFSDKVLEEFDFAFRRQRTKWFLLRTHQKWTEGVRIGPSPVAHPKQFVHSMSNNVGGNAPAELLINKVETLVETLRQASIVVEDFQQESQPILNAKT